MAINTPREQPACHVFTVGSEFYVYDLNAQQLVAVDADLAAALRQPENGSAAALADLQRARENDGLFLAQWPQLIPHRELSESEVDRDLGHLVLTVTEACNLRCAYCLHGASLAWVRNHGTRQMPVQTALAATTYFLDRCLGSAPPTISFYGGEPLLQLDVLAAVINAASRHPRGPDVVFAIDTNGVELSDAALEFIVTERPYLQVSLDGPAACHDRYRRDAQGRPTSARILSNIGRLLDRAPGLADRLTFVATLAPPVNLAAVASYFAAFPPFVERGLEQQPSVTVNLANLNGQDWATAQEEALDLPPVGEQLRAASEMYLTAVAEQKRSEVSPVIRALFEPDLIRLYHRSRAPLGRTFVPGGNCQPGRRKIHVTVDGHLQPCERTGNVMSLGEVATGIQAAAVNRMNREFQAALEGRCGTCWALRLCGVCYAAQAEHGGPAGRDPDPGNRLQSDAGREGTDSANDGAHPGHVAGVSEVVGTDGHEMIESHGLITKGGLMYRKLEAEKKMEESGTEKPAGECGCPCAEPAVDAGEPAPAAKQAVVHLPVYYDING